MAQAITNLMPANVIGGRSARPSLMKSQVDPQMPQSMSQTTRAFIAGCQLPLANLHEPVAQHKSAIGNRHLAIN